MCLMFYPFLFLTCWACALWLLRWITRRLLQAFFTCKNNLNTCLMCDQLDVIYVCFTYVNTLHLSIWSETGHCWSCSSLLYNLVLILVYTQYFYNSCVCQGVWPLDLFRDLICISIWKSSDIFRKVSISLWPLVHVQTLSVLFI